MPSTLSIFLPSETLEDGLVPKVKRIMEPRLATSNKWTPFPEDFTAKILQIFKKNFKNEAKAGEFIVEGRIYSEEILLRIGYLEKGRLKQFNFEASKNYSRDKGESFDAIYLCVDAVGSAMEQHFTAVEAEEEIEFPTRWQEFEFDEGNVFMQVSTVNTKLEAEADKLLEADENKALVYEEQLGEDALPRALVDTELATEVQKKIRKGEKLN